MKTIKIHRDATGKPEGMPGKQWNAMIARRSLMAFQRALRVQMRRAIREGFKCASAKSD